MRFSLLQMNLHHYYVDVSTLGRQKTDPIGQHKLMPTCCLLFIPLTRISNDPGPLKHCYPLGTCLASHLGFLEQDPSLLWKPLTKNSPFAFNSFTLRREEEAWPEATSFLFGPACLSKGNKKQQKWQRRWIPSSLHINLFFCCCFIYSFICLFYFSNLFCSWKRSGISSTTSQLDNETLVTQQWVPVPTWVPLESDKSLGCALTSQKHRPGTSVCSFLSFRLPRGEREAGK